MQGVATSRDAGDAEAAGSITEDRVCGIQLDRCTGDDGGRCIMHDAGERRAAGLCSSRRTEGERGRNARGEGKQRSFHGVLLELGYRSFDLQAKICPGFIEA